MMQKFPTRDSLVWSIGFTASVLAFAATLADLVPAAYAPKALAVSALLGMIAGKLGNSPLKGEAKPAASE